MFSQKLGYFLRSAYNRNLSRGMNCPSCGSNGGVIVDRKYLVTSLVRCNKCALLYRTPTTSAGENRAFYQNTYSQGFTTELPSDAELRDLIASRFNGEKDYEKYIAVLEALGCKKGDRLFDFGCSWGYGSWQLRQYGFDVQSFEISEPRAQFARDKLGVNVFDSMLKVKGPYDVFFSSHVLEHVPSVSEAIQTGLGLLRNGGIFVAFTPNGSTAFRSKNPDVWRKLWGNVHPQFLDDVYYVKQFRRYPSILDSFPYKTEQLRRWGVSKERSISLDLSGDELLCAVYREARYGNDAYGNDAERKCCLDAVN